MQPIRGVAGDALLRYLRKRIQRRRQAALHPAFLRRAREAAGRAVHIVADLPHPSGHIGRRMRSAVRFQRTHAKARLGDVGRSLEPPGRERRLDVADHHQVLAHIRKRVARERRRHVDPLSRVGGCGTVVVGIGGDRGQTDPDSSDNEGNTDIAHERPLRFWDRTSLWIVAVPCAYDRDHMPTLILDWPARLRARAKVRNVTKGTALFRLGERPQAMYFVLAGELRLLRRSRAGGEIVLQRARHGFLAEASLESAKYRCDAVAAQPSEVLRIPIDTMREALDTNPGFRRAWIAHLSHELRRSRAQGERLALKSARDRILHYLDSEGVDGVVTLSVPRKTWATELGLTHETLYRTLARLEAAGLVIRKGAHLRLAKPRAPARRRPT